jgi:hypothetical protein
LWLGVGLSALAVLIERQVLLVMSPSAAMAQL